MSALLLFSAFCLNWQEPAKTGDETLIKALIEVESGGDDWLIGDTNLKNKAYGCLQIRQPCCDDVKNDLGLPNLKAEYCLGNRELSIRIFKAYMKKWAEEKRIGRPPTTEDKARIWNGGPNGWRKKSTEAYWQKVKKELDKEK